MGIDEENVVQGYFELDWNDEFVAMLQSKGITGTSDEDVVNKWFNAVCRTVLLNEQADVRLRNAMGDRDDVTTRDDALKAKNSLATFMAGVEPAIKEAIPTYPR